MADTKTTIVISAVDQTQAALNSVTKGVETLSGTISKIPGFGGITASLTALASVGAFKSLIADTISWAAGMGDLSEITGASVENLSALTKVAKISGTEVPVVEGVLAGAHMANTYGTLRKRYGITTSKQRTFKGLPRETVDYFLAPFRQPAVA